MINTVELFCGSKSFSKVRKKLWDSIFTVDIEKKYKPVLVKNILDLQKEDLPQNINVLWLSPPCTTFSVASAWKYWENNKPKNKEARIWLKILEKSIRLISEINPYYWYLENPRGKMRIKIEEIFNKYHILRKRETITYCQYGLDFMKPTDIWTNNKNWKPRKMCKNWDPCHKSSPRWSSTWLKSLSTPYKRSVIPELLFFEMRKSETYE